MPCCGINRCCVGLISPLVARILQVTQVLDDIDTSPLDIEVDGTSYSADVAASVAQSNPTTTAPPNSGNNGA